MNTCVLTIPERPAHHADISAGIKEYIERVYQQNVIEFVADIGKLQSLRDATVTSSMDATPALAYYGQLGALATKFPASLSCHLVWGSSLGYGVGSVESNCLQFDRINVAYNVGAAATVQGQINMKSDLPKAYHCYQQAAGVFETLLSTELDKFPGQLPIGLDKATIECLKLLCLAQAQECFWANAAHPRDGSKNTVKHATIAKLAEGVRFLYAEAASWAGRSSAIRIEWAQLLQAKQEYFRAGSQYRMALECAHNSSYGEEVAWLQESMKSLKSAQLYVGKVDRLLGDNIEGLSKRVTSDLKRAEKDNSLIYLQMVPHSLPAIARTVAAQPNSKTLATADEQARAAPLFRLLLPFPVFQAPKAYREKLELFVDKYVVKELQKLNDKVLTALTDMHLPGALEAAQRPTEVPGFLIDQHEAIVRAGGLQDLQRRRSEVEQLREQVSNELGDLKTAISRAFPQPQLSEVREPYDAIVSKYERLVNYLRVGRTSDGKVGERLAQSEHLIRVLIEGDAAISRFLPDPVAQSPNKELSSICADLQATVGTLIGNSAKRTAYGERVMVKAASIDIMSMVMEYVKGRVAPIERASDLDPVYTQLVREFDPAFKHLKIQQDEVDAMLNAATAQNKVFQEKLAALGNRNQTRQLAVEALETASVRYGEIRANIEEGRNFYEALRVEIDKLVHECSEYSDRFGAPQTPQSPGSPDSPLDDFIGTSQSAPTHDNRVTPVSTPFQGQLGHTLHRPRPSQMPGVWDPDTPVRFG